MFFLLSFFPIVLYRLILFFPRARCDWSWTEAARLFFSRARFVWLFMEGDYRLIFFSSFLSMSYVCLTFHGGREAAELSCSFFILLFFIQNVCMTIYIIINTMHWSVFSVPPLYKSNPRTPPTTRTHRSQKTMLRNRLASCDSECASIQRSWGLWPFMKGWEAARLAFFFLFFLEGGLFLLGN